MKDIKLKGSPALGLTGTTLGFFFGFAAVSLYGPTAIKFQEAMDLSPFLLGLLVAIPSLSAEFELSRPNAGMVLVGFNFRIS